MLPSSLNKTKGGLYINITIKNVVNALIDYCFVCLVERKRESWGKLRFISMGEFVMKCFFFP